MPKKISKIIKKITNAKVDHLADIRTRVAKAPEDPGIYRWLDEKGEVLYVGKAKNLRNRLKSYVVGDGHSHGPWKQSFLRQVRDFQVTITNTELEALIFETNLIKELKPKYNVLMKDDKNYVYVRITNDTFPRVESVRKMDHKDKADYFGPMLSGGEVWHMLGLLRRVFPFRTCGMEIEITNDKSQITDGGGKIPLEVICTHKDRPTPCLDYHIQKCLAPCIGNITPKQYKHDVIDGIVRFLKGDYAYVAQVLQVRMQQAAMERKFELAAALRDQLTTIDRLRGKQVVSDTSGEDSDAVAIAVRSGRAHVVVLQKRSGKLIGDEHFALKGETEEPAEVLSQFLPQYYAERPVPPLILVSEELENTDALEAWFKERRGTKVELTVPSRGLKSQLLKLAEKNVAEKARQHEHSWESKKRNTEEALKELQERLLLQAPPARIECYDISHLGGTETVASMTVAINGECQSKHYRSFHIRSLKSGDVDDYQSLREAISRRCRRLKDDLPAEEEKWKEKGIEVRWAKKSDAKKIVELRQLRGLSTTEEAYKDFFVAAKGDDLVAFARLEDRPKDIHEVRSVWVHDELRGERLGLFVVRKILRSVKKGRVYLACEKSLEQYYGEIGFRYIIKPPTSLLEAIKEDGYPNVDELLIMMYEVSLGKPDASFSMRPDLMVIDGGKGQLSAVADILDQFQLDIPVIGLAKREEEIFVRGQSEPVVFPKDSQGRFLLMRLRDEAHRFANAGRETRGKKDMFHSQLDEVPGIGDTTKEQLMKKFVTVAAIKAASDNDLLEILSEGQLKQLRNVLR